MKRFLLALVVIGMTIGLSSCTKEYITNYLPGVSYVVPVTSNQWTGGGNGIYQTTIAMKDLDKAYFEDGHVNVAVSFNSNADYYENIPGDLESFYKINNEERVTLHSYSAKYSIGQVVITAERLGGDNRAPEDMLVKIVLTDADIGN
ncbi:hypothetical protein [Sphingobacterium sp. SYP-B4668]|uniref:hypothetical protein n=1 Tax=Sphingobacterium sp. SYP-B4668 TaxID=2996035 RepID=UPI0022DE9416|nr:hypothetical protein [Sphingobacterium sp. SYP-B4668]